MSRIALIGCTKKKKDKECKAVELYTESALFCKELEYAREVFKADKIYILSAKHHLIHESKVIAPYNETLNNKRIGERREWAKIVLESIKKEFDPDADFLCLLCGSKYYEFLEDELKAMGIRYTIPMKGVGRIGNQLQWLSQKTEK